MDCWQTSQVVRHKVLTLAETLQIFSFQSHNTGSVWLQSLILMQKDPRQAGEGEVTR